MSDPIIIIRMPVSYESKMRGLGMLLDMEKDNYVEKLQALEKILRDPDSIDPLSIARYALIASRISIACNLLGFANIDDLNKFIKVYGFDALIE